MTSALHLAERFLTKLHTLLLATGFQQIGRGAAIAYPLRFGGERHITIGSGVYAGPHCWFQVLDAERPPGRPILEIGPDCSFSGFCTITAVQSVVLEESVLVARYVHISDHAHAFAAAGRPVKDQGIGDIRPVHIGRGAWIGQGAVICPGVRIGRNAVIGANSVVRSDVEDFCIAAGSPARTIRHITESHFVGT